MGIEIVLKASPLVKVRTVLIGAYLIPATAVPSEVKTATELVPGAAALVRATVTSTLVAATQTDNRQANAACAFADTIERRRETNAHVVIKNGHRGSVSAVDSCAASRIGKDHKKTLGVLNGVVANNRHGERFADLPVSK